MTLAGTKTRLCMAETPMSTNLVVAPGMAGWSRVSWSRMCWPGSRRGGDRDWGSIALPGLIGSRGGPQAFRSVADAVTEP
jgi:hypothetical protein